MIKYLVAIAAFAVSVVPAQAQPGGADPAAACPAGTRYATIRHSMVQPGKWAEFGQAVADHSAWYAAHKDSTTTKIARIITRGSNGAILSDSEAATITIYSDKPQPEHDAAYAAFLAKYKVSSTIKDEMRLCLPN